MSVWHQHSHNILEILVRQEEVAARAGCLLMEGVLSCVGTYGTVMHNYTTQWHRNHGGFRAGAPITFLAVTYKIWNRQLLILGIPSLHHLCTTAVYFVQYGSTCDYMCTWAGNVYGQVCFWNPVDENSFLCHCYTGSKVSAFQEVKFVHLYLLVSCVCDHEFLCIAGLLSGNMYIPGYIYYSPI